MSASKEFLEIVNRMQRIHVKKNADYAGDKEPLFNFKFAASLVQYFHDPLDQVFVALIGVKLARLAVLLENNREPINESIIDTFIDGPNYFALWGASRMERTKNNDTQNFSQER